jgi:hypothetical protein
MTTIARRAALAAWIALGVLTTGVLLAGLLLPVWISLFMLLPALVVWLVLLIVYNRALAGWRVLVLIWSAFGVLRACATWVGAGADVLRSAIAALLAVVSLYALVAGYAALIALVVHRDVSVADIFIPTALGAMMMVLTVQSAGGVAQWFDALTAPPTIGRLLVLEPLLLSMTCMGTLGFLAVVPHMIITVVREMRGN